MRVRGRLPTLVVGYGPRGQRWARRLRRSRSFRLAGIVDPDAAALVHARSRGVRTWGSLSDALAAAVPDAMVIASVPGAHAEQTIEALEAGVPVLVEKPAALSYSRAVELAEASARTGAPVTVVQNFRFLRREIATVRILRSGTLGRLRQDLIVSARPPTLVRPHVAEMAYGPLWDICLHLVDALRTRYGLLPEEVSATVSPDGLRAHRSTYLIEINWPAGFRTSLVHHEGASAYSFSEYLEGDEGVLRLTDRTSTLARGSGRPRVRPLVAPGDPDATVLRHFRRAIATGDAGSLGISDNVDTVALVEAAAASLDRGGPVSIAEVTGPIGRLTSTAPHRPPADR